MEYKLSELVTIKYGKNQSEVVDIDGKYPILGTGGIIGYSNQYLYNKPSVLIGRKGNIKNVKYIDKPFWTIDTLFYTIINENIAIPKYLFYKLSQLDLSTYNEGSAVPSLTTSTLNQIEIDIPTLEEQKRIVDILTSLDDKIELNNQMNQTLEEIASLLYKRWFVDFEFPDDKGKPYKSSGGEMVDSELGMIPKGWEVKELGEIIKFIKGKKPNKIKENKVVGYERYMTIKGITNTEILYADPENTIKIGHNDVSMVMDGASSGDIYTNIEGVLSSTFSKIETEVPNSYIFQVLNYYESDIKKNLTGSAIPHTDKGYINRLLIVVPKNLLLEKLSKKFAFFIQYINGNIKESNVLSEQKKIILKILI